MAGHIVALGWSVRRQAGGSKTEGLSIRRVQNVANADVELDIRRDRT